MRLIWDRMKKEERKRKRRRVIKIEKKEKRERRRKRKRKRRKRRKRNTIDSYSLLCKKLRELALSVMLCTLSDKYYESIKYSSIFPVSGQL